MFSKIYKAIFDKIKFDSLILFKLFLIFFSSVLVLVVIEFFLIIFNYPYFGCKEVHLVQEAYFGHYDEITGWAYNESTSYYGVYEGIEHHFNDKGIRVANHKQDFNNQSKKILFIGDSVTFGTGLNYEETFAHKIEKNLRDTYDLDIQAINLGVQGYGTDQSLLQLQKFISLYNPIAVVYTFNPDHMYLRNINANRRIHFKCLEFPGTKPRFSIHNGELVLTKKPLSYFDYDKFKLIALANDALDYAYEQKMKKFNNTLELTDSLIEKIDSTVKNEGAVPFYIFYDNSDSAEANLNNNQILENLFLSRNRKVLDFYGWSNGFTVPFISKEDGFHPSASASSKIADDFIEKFAQDIFSLLNIFQE